MVLYLFLLEANHRVGLAVINLV